MTQLIEHEKWGGPLRMLLIMIAVFAVVILLSRGCSSDHKQSSNAPLFTLKDTHGKEYFSSQLMGKAAVINFFTTWCPACIEEIPGFISVYENYKERDFELIGIALDADAKTLSDFVDARKINYRVLLGNMDTVRAYGGFKAVPTTFFIGKDGEIKDIVTGYINKDDFERKVLKLLQ
ncbi:MAG: TlpA family protein disulfide reductase [Syntrophorhabdaceae bacterium]|nr:TlpA family protein disulfide reductase [Syntrophorhabdaceae bacterium]